MLRRASCFVKQQQKSCRARRAKQDGGEGWIRTSVRLRGQIYSLLPLTTRPPLHEACHAQTIRGMAERGEAGAPCGGASWGCQRREDCDARPALLCAVRFGGQPSLK